METFLKAAEGCHKAGFPFGIGLGQTADSVDTAGAVFQSFGAELVDAKGNLWGTNAYGVFDMVGNLHEWVDDPDGTFQGGYYLDTHINGDGCYYRTTFHAMSYYDYSTGFRCCADVDLGNL